MKISAINNRLEFKGSIYGNIEKGRKEFNALSPTEQAIKCGIEQFRQRFNRHNNYTLSCPNNDLNGYIRYRIMISNAVKKATAKFAKQFPKI